MTYITLPMFAMQAMYKSNGYSGKITHMLAPCNALWVLAMILVYYPNLSNSISQRIVHLFITFVMLPVIALSVPDVEDCTLFLEIPYFFLHHILLILIPLYYVVTGRVSVLREGGGERYSASSTSRGKYSLVMVASLNIRHWLYGTAYFMLLYFPIVSLINIWSGLNVNYMLSPPPNPGNVIDGDNFRLMSTVCCSTVFVIGRGLMILVEIIINCGWNTREKRN